MSIRFYLFVIMFILLTSSASVGLLFFYMNPIPHPTRSLTLMGIGLFLMVASLLAPLIFFLKKVYYRGDVNLSTMSASIRQAILLALTTIFFMVLSLYNIQEWHITLTGLATLACVEVMFQALD